MALSSADFEDIGDPSSRRAFFALLERMCSGDLPSDEPPRFHALEQYAEPAKALFDRYKAEGTGALWWLFHLMPQLLKGLDYAIEEWIREEEGLDEPMRVYTVDELLEQKPVRFIDADRTLQANGVTMIAGQPGTGKSLWLLRKADEIALTQPVLVVAAEAQGGLADRIRALEIANGRPLSRSVHVMQEPVLLHQPEQVNAFIRKARAYNPKIIAFDTWAACTAGMDENTVHEVTPVQNAIGRIMSILDCAVLIIHHTRKDGTVYRGSSAILGWVDNMFMLSAEDGQVVLKAQKTRDTHHAKPLAYKLVEFETRTDPDTGAPVKASALVPAGALESLGIEATSLNGNRQAVLEALDGVHGVSAQALEGITGLSTGTLHRALKDLMAAEMVSQEKYGAPYQITAKGRAFLANRPS